MLVYIGIYLSITFTDRLRDTLIHEMCHAATWLINGVRDGHGSFWKLYARKATVAHPELPTVTRCHSYDIKYKFQYQCTRCQNTYVWLLMGLLKLVIFLFILHGVLICTLHHKCSQDWASFQVAGHSEVCVRPLHRTAGFTDAIQATCCHAVCQLCQRKLWDSTTRACRTKPRRRDA